ncbi:MAG TPA: hypothetical protein VNF04_15980 [Stellaceae bacterium]|nr:hypothetical protein [Stellaceae bacterium]
MRHEYSAARPALLFLIAAAAAVALTGCVAYPGYPPYSAVGVSAALYGYPYDTYEPQPYLFEPGRERHEFEERREERQEHDHDPR